MASCLSHPPSRRCRSTTGTPAFAPGCSRRCRAGSAARTPWRLARTTLEAEGVAEAEIQRRLSLLRDRRQELENDFWNRFFTVDAPRFNTSPNAFLAATVEGRAPGRALDVGMDEGRNALFLAKLGWKVTGFDPADKAVALARDRAKALDVPAHSRRRWRSTARSTSAASSGRRAGCEPAEDEGHMITTRMTDMLGLRYPIMSPPMALHSGGALAAAVSHAGALGSFGGLPPTRAPRPKPWGCQTRTSSTWSSAMGSCMPIRTLAGLCVVSYKGKRGRHSGAFGPRAAFEAGHVSRHV